MDLSVHHFSLVLFSLCCHFEQKISPAGKWVKNYVKQCYGNCLMYLKKRFLQEGAGP